MQPISLNSPFAVTIGAIIGIVTFGIWVGGYASANEAMKEQIIRIEDNYKKLYSDQLETNKETAKSIGLIASDVAAIKASLEYLKK